MDYEDLKDLRDRTNDLRETMARIATNQEFFRETMSELAKKQNEIFERICARLDRTDTELRSLENKITWYSGAAAVIVAGSSFIIDYIIKKIGA